MLWWALVFLIVAVVAAIFGFGSVASAATDIALIIFWIFIALIIVSLLLRLLRR